MAALRRELYNEADYASIAWVDPPRPHRLHRPVHPADAHAQAAQPPRQHLRALPLLPPAPPSRRLHCCPTSRPRTTRPAASTSPRQQVHQHAVHLPRARPSAPALPAARAARGRLLLGGGGRDEVPGYNGSQLWDTAFAAQAIVESGMGRAFPDVLRKAYAYLELSQVQEDVAQRVRFYRHLSNAAGRSAPSTTAGPSPTALARHQGHPRHPLGRLLLPHPPPPPPRHHRRAAAERRALPADLPERRRRLGDVREPPRGRLDGVAEPRRGVQRHHGRLFLRRVPSAAMTALVAFRREWPQHRAGRDARP